MKDLPQVRHFRSGPTIFREHLQNLSLDLYKQKRRAKEELKRHPLFPQTPNKTLDYKLKRVVVLKQICAFQSGQKCKFVKIMSKGNLADDRSIGVQCINSIESTRIISNSRQRIRNKDQTSPWKIISFRHLLVRIYFKGLKQFSAMPAPFTRTRPRQKFSPDSSTWEKRFVLDDCCPTLKSPWYFSTKSKLAPGDEQCTTLGSALKIWSKTPIIKRRRLGSYAADMRENIGRHCRKPRYTGRASKVRQVKQIKSVLQIKKYSQEYVSREK